MLFDALQAAAFSHRGCFENVGSQGRIKNNGSVKSETADQLHYR
jgi:hypothetical protein